MQSNIIFINSHPIQYFAPLYKYLHEKGLPLEVWYCSNETINGYIDKQFGTFLKWDVPLLDGYSYRFFANRSFRPSIYCGFWGLFNPGLIWNLFRIPKATVIVHGWGYSTLVLAIILGALRGHRICLRSETPLNQEIKKGVVLRFVKRLILKTILFRFVELFLYIGTQNRLFYQSLGIHQSRLLFTPYAVDNERFQLAANELKSKKNQFRTELGLKEGARVFLFVAKLIDKKRPMDVLRAFRDLNDNNCSLIMVGEGELRSEIEGFIKDEGLKGVLLAGFKNQTEIARYYATADVFILPSGIGETWGLVVNEAMNFGLALIVADLAGCSSDLVMNEANGLVYQSGNVPQLVDCMQKSEILNGSLGLLKLKEYSYERIHQTLGQI